MPRIEQRFGFSANMDDTCDDATWQILKAYFKDIKPIERYFNVSLSYIFNQTLEEIYKKTKDHPHKIDQRKIKRIKVKVIKRLRTRYGQWISFLLKYNRRNGKSFC